MGPLFIVVGCLMVIAALVTIVGMTLGDIRAIRLKAAFRKHPHSRRFRRRPLLSIIIHDTATDACIDAIERISYRKIEVIFSGEEPSGDILLYLKKDTVLDPHMISSAVQQFNIDSKLDAIELLPAFAAPSTIRELFHIYRSISLAPFIPVRAAFHAVPHWSGWPVMIRRGTQPDTVRLYVSRLFRWFALCANALVLLYASYLAVILYEPFFLMVYLGGFCAWMTLAISTYPYFSLAHRVQYLLLTPVSFWYFFFRAFRAPFNPFLHRARAAISKTFWRAYGQPTA